MWCDQLMVDRAMESNKLFGIIPAANSCGTVLEIVNCQRTAQGTYNISCVARKRFTVKMWWEEVRRVFLFVVLCSYRFPFLISCLVV
jgi:Lon protease-like protein